MSKPVVLTGLRANNDLTLGNYLGALLPIIDMAKKHAGEYQINLFVPDLHSFTTPVDHSQLYGQILQNVRAYIAAGMPLENPDVYIYRQSRIPAHSELTWILDCFTGFGEMSRMTPFKEKIGLVEIENQEIANATKLDSYIRSKLKITPDMDPAAGMLTMSEVAQLDPEGEILALAFQRYAINISKEMALGKTTVGLFNYPVLMAADILLYNASYVPVGDDQTQHLEFTRDIAIRLNNRFGELFTVPLPVQKQHAFFGKDQGLRVRDLQDPAKKMSKSDETGKGVIFMSDSPEVATQKIMSAATDSYGEIKYDLKERPGISNLLQILALLSGRERAEVCAEWEGKSSYGDLKKAVAEVVGTFLRDFQAKLAGVSEQDALQILEKSEAVMRETANETLLRAQKAVGLRA